MHLETLKALTAAQPLGTLAPNSGLCVGISATKSTGFSPASLLSMSNIDSVTRSFATSLAIASNDVVDISAVSDGGAQRTSQSYLLAWLLSLKPTTAMDLRRHFRRVWVLNQGFAVQQRTPNRFLFSFDLRSDCRKVMMGGPWSFNRTLVVMQPYDGIAPLQSIPMQDLFFWVRITNMPPAYEQRKTIANVASVAGKYLDIDGKLFDATGEIRVCVSHSILKPFFPTKTLKFARGVEQEVHFLFENLVGECDICARVFHENGPCKPDPVPPSVKTVDQSVARKLELTNQFLGFHGPQFKEGTFRFQGITTPILPPVGRSLFGGAESSRPRRPVIIRNAESRVASDEGSRAIVPVETESQAKRGRPFPSPKKLLFLMSDLLEGKTSPVASAKKVKMPEFSSKLSAKSLGLVESPGGMLVPAEVMTPVLELPGTKKKKGRPLGSKNKNPKTKKVSAEEVLTVLYSGKPPSPSLKDKEKI